MPVVAVSVVFAVYSSTRLLLLEFCSSFKKRIRNRCRSRNSNSNHRSICHFLSIVNHLFVNVCRLLSVPNAVTRITFFYVNDIRSRYGCLDPLYRILNYANCYADRFVCLAKNTSFKCILRRLVAWNCISLTYVYLISTRARVQSGCIVYVSKQRDTAIVNLNN